jgi:hypothetical protein
VSGLGTCRYTHYRSRGGEAARLAPAFQTADLQAELQLSEVPEPATAFQTVPPSKAETPAQTALSWNRAAAV